MRSRIPAVFLTLFVFTPETGRSDSREDWKRKPPGRFHFGPFWLTPKIELRNAGVDTNVNNNFRNPVADNSVVVRPGLRAALPVGRRIRLQGNGHLDFNYFRRQSTERSTDFGLDGKGDLDVGSFTFSGGGGGGQERLRHSVDSDERLRRLEQFAFGGVDLRLGRATEIRARVGVSGYRYEPSQIIGADFQRALNRNSKSGRAELRYNLTALTALAASTEVIEDTFVHQRERARITRSYRSLAGFDFGDKAILSGMVRAGVRQFPGSSAGSAPSYTGPAFKVETSARVRSFARIRLTADGDVYYAVGARPTVAGPVRNSHVSRRYEAGLEVDLPLGLLARGAFGVHSARYLAAYVIDRRIARRVDRLYSSEGTLVRRVGDSFRIGGTVAWTRRVSNLPGLSYQGWRYGLSAEIVP